MTKLDKQILSKKSLKQKSLSMWFYIQPSSMISDKSVSFPKFRFVNQKSFSNTVYSYITTRCNQFCTGDWEKKLAADAKKQGVVF